VDTSKKFFIFLAVVYMLIFCLAFAPLAQAYDILVYDGDGGLRGTTGSEGGVGNDTTGSNTESGDGSNPNAPITAGGDFIGK
jgi:hypothetical protein